MTGDDPLLVERYCPVCHAPEGDCVDGCQESDEQTGAIAARCTRCGGEFTKDQMVGAKCCPACGTRGVPCDPANDVQVTINWHELRVLCMWAERWAERCDLDGSYDRAHTGERAIEVVHTIAARLQRQHVGRSPLTFAGEITDLRAAGYRVEVHGSPDPGDKGDA